MHRRSLLVAGVAALPLSVAGCLGDGPESGGGTDDDPGSGDETGDLEYETIQYAATQRGDWFEDVGDQVGSVVVIDSEERASVIRPHDEVDDDRREEVADFLEAVNFEDSVLLYLESVGPTACHDGLDVEDVTLEDGALTARASVVETDEDADVCAEVITFPSALVRVTFDREPVTDVEVEFVDGWGEEGTITASADDPLSPDPDELEGEVRPEGDPETVPDGLACETEDRERVEWWTDEEDLEWGEGVDVDGDPGLALRVDSTAVELGETVTVSMTNVADEELLTGNRHRHWLEVYTEDGWKDVRVRSADDPLEYTDEGISHPPGEGFEWTIELSEAGVLADHVHEDRLEVCPDLQAGRYRFSFEGVAVAFDVRE